MLTNIIGSLTSRQFAKSYERNQGSNKRQNSAQTEAGKRLLSDAVEISHSVPKPFSVRQMQQAEPIAQKLAAGEKITVFQQQKIRGERVFAALVALQAMDANPAIGRIFSPVGVPKPNKAELKEAYKRLTQHLSNNNSQVEAQLLQQFENQRINLLDKFRMTDFSSAGF